MKEQLTISISSVSGSKQWQLNTRGKRRLKVLGITTTSLTLGVFLVLGYLYLTVDVVQVKNLQLISQSNSLNSELNSLVVMKEQLEQDLQQREAQVALVSDRLSDIESLLNADESSVEEATLLSRLELAAITSSTRVMMLHKIPSGSPVGDVRISSNFGSRVHPVTKQKKMHRGIDFAVNTGTKIYAPADGVVEVTRQSNQGSGNFLRLQHDYGFSSSYSHLDQFKVRSGQLVRKGELIAISGNSGLSSGPHLHYEVRFIGRALDPLNFVRWDVDKFEDIIVKERGIPWDSLVQTVELRVAQLLQPSLQKGATLAGNLK
ncbi:peptidoglycan DD-metalloendopeptidase family protein [Vibrio sp. FNV 38]|nr:peptidoglycan DD-metalloendopeptidase family protein [Vibrio sp. FNV 38]